MDQIEKRINAVKRKMHELGPMRPGSLSRQTHRAGGEGAAYYQASYTFRRKGYTDYVRAEDYPRVKKETENFRRFKELCDELVELSIRWSKSKNAAQDEEVPRGLTQARQDAARLAHESTFAGPA